MLLLETLSVFSFAAGTGQYSIVGVSTSSKRMGIYSSALEQIESTIISNNTIQNISLSGAFLGVLLPSSSTFRYSNC